MLQRLLLVLKRRACAFPPGDLGRQLVELVRQFSPVCLRFLVALLQLRLIGHLLLIKGVLGLLELRLQLLDLLLVQIQFLVHVAYIAVVLVFDLP